jgi:hypothetical protein
MTMMRLTNPSRFNAFFYNNLQILLEDFCQMTYTFPTRDFPCPTSNSLILNIAKFLAKPEALPHNK